MGLHLAKWPSKSPDLNVAELVWAQMDRFVKIEMCSHNNPTRADLINSINNAIDYMQQRENVYKRRHFIMHAPIAMLECIAAGGGEPYKYHVRPHVNENT
jgi:hypothetical protein